MAYIDKDKLIGELHTQFFYDGRDRTRVYAKIQEQPTADVPERNVGKWEKMWHSYFKQEVPCCSVCGHFSAMRWKFCPNCGSRNEG